MDKTKPIILNQEQRNLLIGLLENTKDNFDMSDSMEFSPTINEILEELNK